jgi:hypothetical protein
MHNMLDPLDFGGSKGSLKSMMYAQAQILTNMPVPVEVYSTFFSLIVAE